MLTGCRRVDELHGQREGTVAHTDAGTADEHVKHDKVRLKNETGRDEEEKGEQQLRL